MAWFRNAPQIAPADVAVDVHSHLVPGVDDGVASLDDALTALKTFSQLGYRGVITTPHIWPDAFQTTEMLLRDAFQSLERVAAEQVPGFQLTLGAEYMVDDLFMDRLFREEDTFLTFGAVEAPYLLVEFPTSIAPFMADDLFDEVRRRGWRLIIAHVERYAYVNRDPGLSMVRAWRERGCLIQVNLGSLVGQYGTTIRKAAHGLLKQGLIDLVGSDLHRGHHAQRFLPKAWQVLGRTNAFSPDAQRALWRSVQAANLTDAAG